jgi:RHS repeat-associated protein
MNGEIAWAAEYKAWGYAYDALSKAGRQAGLKQPIRFQGQYYDHETGLHYNRHRYYDPHSGRFVSKDPIGLRGGINVHSYGDNPITWVDPMGLQTYMSQNAGLPAWEYKENKPITQIHGNWCGPNWTGGFRKPWDKMTPAEQQLADTSSYRAPVDELDSCCKVHDKAHAACRARFPCDYDAQQRCLESADRALAACSNNAPTNNKWHRTEVHVYMSYSQPGAEIKSTCSKEDPRDIFGPAGYGP